MVLQQYIIVRIIKKSSDKHANNFIYYITYIQNLLNSCPKAAPKHHRKRKQNCSGNGLTESLFDMALCCSWGTADAIFDSVVSKGWSELSLEEVRPMIRRLQKKDKKKVKSPYMYVCILERPTFQGHTLDSNPKKGQF